MACFLSVQVVGQQVEVQVAVKPDNTLRAQRIRLLREGRQVEGKELLVHSQRCLGLFLS